MVRGYSKAKCTFPLRDTHLHTVICWLSVSSPWRRQTSQWGRLF